LFSEATRGGENREAAPKGGRISDADLQSAALDHFDLASMPETSKRRQQQIASTIPERRSMEQSDRQITFEAEVTGRFGILPNFFRSARAAPELIQQLWSFAKAGGLPPENSPEKR
jgi:hypothetical protein